MCIFTISPAGSFGSIQKLSSPAAAVFPDQFRQNTVQVTDNSVVGNIEDQGSWICVDRDNTGRVPHADYMLYRTGDAAVDIEAGGQLSSRSVRSAGCGEPIPCPQRFSKRLPPRAAGLPAPVSAQILQDLPRSPLPASGVCFTHTMIFILFCFLLLRLVLSP